VKEELVCYARSVAGVQWDRMQAGTIGDDLNPWATKLFRTLKRADPETPTEQAAYSKWLDERSAREEARDDRIHGATGVIPLPLWIVLFFISALIFVYTLFFADSGEPAVVQALIMGSVVAVVVSTLLLLQFLNDPFHEGVGGLRPVAMERTLRVIDQELGPAQRQMRLPCDARGNAL
jgi:succinate dehydrogenase/fumarate reductase cytochrome b subunit